MGNLESYAAMQGWVGWPQEWDFQASIYNRAEAQKLISRCRDRVKVMKSALANLAQAKGAHAASRLQRRFLMSWSARLHALARAYCRKVASIENAPDSDLQELLSSAAHNSPWVPSKEKAVAIPKEKRLSGEHRWVHVHGGLLYANELIARDAAEPLTPLLATQFLSRGGEPKLKDWLSENLSQTKVVITVDVPSCFDKIVRSSVEDSLVLPGRVVREVLFNPTDNATFLQPTPKQYQVGDGSIAKVNSGKRGIAQGSALATLASEAVICEILRDVAGISPAISIGSHGDNIIILLKEAELAGSVINRLTAAVEKHFGADVLPEFTCRITKSTAAEGFVFCRRHYSHAAGKLRVRTPQRVIDDFVMKTMVTIGEAYYGKDIPRFRHLERSIKGWMRASPYSDQVLDEGADLLAHLKSMWPTKKPAKQAGQVMPL